MYLAINKMDVWDYHSFEWNAANKLVINGEEVNPNDWEIIEVEPTEHTHSPKKQIDMQISKDLLQKLYSMADHPTQLELENKYPDLFEELYDFGESHVISYHQGRVDDAKPLIICFGYAPSIELQNKCLKVGDGFKAKLFEYEGSQFLKFIYK